LNADFEKLRNLWLNRFEKFMFLTLLFVFLISLSGSVLTYLYSAEEKLLVRLCAGNIIGSALFGLVAFLIACAFGLTKTTILLSLFITLLPAVLLIKKDWREKFFANFKASRQTNSNNWLGAAFYIVVFVLLYFFFERAMLETPQGIFTGGSQNLGDLPFHLGAIFSFSDGHNLPPENPSFAFAKFTYPFMTDFITACFVTLGATARDAMLWQNVTLAFSLVVLFENFAWRLTKNRLAGKLAPVIFLFSGGLGFVIFFRDYWQDGRPLFEFIWNLPADYTIREKGIRWGNSLVALFMTQRGLLLGMPITLIVLTCLWKIFNAETPANTNEQRLEAKLSTQHSALRTVFIGLLAGSLPLVHVHSLAVLFVVCAFLFFFSFEKWRVWLVFGVSVAIVAVPELIWIMTGSATRLKEFIDWNFGWDARGENIFIFWAKNLGLFIPLLILAFWWLFHKEGKERNEARINADESGLKTGEAIRETHRSPLTAHHLYFYLPFLLIFIIANLLKLAPWEWDNIKVLIYWFVASVPFVAWLLARVWEKGTIYKFVSIACLVILTFSGALDVWRVVTRQINYQVFSRDAVKIAGQIKQKTAPDALFLNAPTYNSAVVLSGRRSLMRYSGHLSSYGIDYIPRETEVKRIYEGTALAEALLKRNGIEYVLISPEEKSNLTIDEGFFSKYPVIAEAGEYRVYQIKK
jgi:hypothetical protein